MTNYTVTEFLLMGFSDDRNMQILYFMMFLCIYLLALIWNGLIITAVALNYQLHSPMYFFLANLSFIDICYISTTVPKSMATSLTNDKLIYFFGCFAQVFLVITFAGSELAFLTAMAYDRYIAICHPLQYRIIMNWDACMQMAAASWTLNLLHALFHTGITFRLNFCGPNMIGQFFCDIPQLQKISCSDTKLNEVLVFVFGLSMDGLYCTLIFVSYGYIFSTVLRLPSLQSRHKAFSICIPHLTVFSLFIITSLFSYMRPQSLSSPAVDLLSAFLYAVIPPVLNPIIYSLRNKDIQKAVWKIPQMLKTISHSMMA